ncbi:unnamed protein product, partial [Mesorhabditis belari]|uniref:Uncharacterized protein n=1 Tax=Mesorhabditis belari TaxID=2138241 RepID=A0AAF3EXI2_9BILA
MALLPLSVYDELRRCFCEAGTSQQDKTPIARRFCANASLGDLLRWRTISRAFLKEADARLAQFTRLHIKVYEGLYHLHKQRTNTCKSMTGDVNWHPSACLLLCEMDAQTLGIAVDAKPSWKDIAALIKLLQFFRQTMEFVHMDSPIIELLLKDLNNQKVTELLKLLNMGRRPAMSSSNQNCAHHFSNYCVAPLFDSHPLSGPFFPCLKQFTITSNPKQLNALSRLMNYSIAVDMIFQKEQIDLVCLQVILGESWCRSKHRLFRHVNTFKKWSEASELGVRYVQQFQGDSGKRRKAKI